MKDWIITATRIVKGELETDSFTFSFSLRELEKYLMEIKPLIDECQAKNIDLEIICNELYCEHQEILEALYYYNKNK